MSTPPADRRKVDAKTCELIEKIEVRLDEGDVRMNRIEAAQNASNNDIAEMLDILRLGKSFFRLAGYFGTFVKWSVGIAGAVATMYYAVKGGKWP
jgi:hypothetical protein